MCFFFLKQNNYNKKADKCLTNKNNCDIINYIFLRGDVHMSKFAEFFFGSFKNATHCACSSCGAKNSATTNFNARNFSDTVFAVSLFFAFFISIIILALLGLINIIILAGIIIINIICLSGTNRKSKTLKFSCGN